MFDRQNYTMVPIYKVNTPPLEDGEYMVLIGRWWAVKDGCLLFFQGESAQCNRSKDIARRLTPEGCETWWIPAVYIPLKWTDDGNLPSLGGLEND